MEHKCKNWAGERDDKKKFNSNTQERFYKESRSACDYQNRKSSEVYKSFDMSIIIIEWIVRLLE